MELATKILSDITVHMKYAKFLPKQNRREAWEELVTRNKEMHQKTYPTLQDEIEQAYKLVYDKKVLPSMRSLQFGGRPIEISPNRIYNCAFAPIDHIDVFAEIMFLLLGGTGVGYSVQQHHIEQLPEIRKPLDRKRRFLVGDSIEGWADAIKVLFHAYFRGKSDPVFDFTDIRPKGANLVTSGGKAPGPQPLKDCIHHIRSILDAKQLGENLTTLEAHDIVCHIADAVLAGGIRRAALIALFSVDDNEMMTAKFGNWWETNPQRGRANNSAVLLRHRITKQTFLNLWDKVKNSGSGEPGIYFSNDKEWGTNPSLRKGTRVWTSEGVLPIEQLEDKTFYVRNLNGELSKAKCWLSGTGKKLYKITLEGGHEYYATAEHEWPVWNGETYTKLQTPKVEAGNYMKFLRTDEISKGTLGSYEDGFFAGWQLGDGWTSTKKDGSVVQGLVVSAKDDRSNISDRLQKFIKESLDSSANFALRSSNCKEVNTTNNTWNEFQNTFKYAHKSEGLPKTVWNEASESFRRGLIDGLFSADGSVEVTKKRIAFHTAHTKLATDVSDLLGLYGVKHSKRFTANESKGCYLIDIMEGESIRRFKDLFNLSVREKQDRIDNYTFNTNIQPNDKIKVVDVEETDLFEDVWDITVYDQTHAFQLPHVVTGNCAEIALRPYQFCNLTEINASDIEDQQDLNQRAKVGAFIGTLQAGYTDFHYLRDVWKKTTEKDALIGVGMTGIASNACKDLNLLEATNVVIEENKRVANLLGINPAARTTTVKPSGTSSLVLGTSSGIHAWHNDYYIRRIRVGKNESIYNYLALNHPELIEDEFFRPNDQAVISIPQRAPATAAIRTESVTDLLERVQRWNLEWVKAGHLDGQNTHNVSATISVKEDQWEPVGEWMWENRETFNGLSVLPYSEHSYKQAPFTDCTKEEYEELFKSLKSIDLTKIVELSDNTDLRGELACAGSSCEIT